MSRGIVDSHTYRIKRGATSASEIGRENRHESQSQVQPSTPVIRCDCCFLKTEEDAPMFSVLIGIDTVYKQMVAVPDEKEG